MVLVVCQLSLVRFDPSFVIVEQSFIVSQIVGYPVILSTAPLLESVNKSFVRCWLLTRKLLTTVQ